MFYYSKFSRAASFTRYLNCFQCWITIYHIGCSFNYRTGIHLIVLFLLCLDKVPLSLLFFNVTKSFVIYHYYICLYIYCVCSFTTAFCYTIDLISHVIIFYVFFSFFYFFIIILLWRCMFIEWLWWCWCYLNIFYHSCHSPQIVSLSFSFTYFFFLVFGCCHFWLYIVWGFSSFSFVHLFIIPLSLIKITDEHEYQIIFLFITFMKYHRV